MNVLVPEGWGEFGVAAAGATAALAGLLVVAISVNIREILASPSSTAGARSTIATLVLAIVTSLLLLVPGQSLLALGVEVLILTLLAAAVQVGAIAAQFRRHEKGMSGGVRATILLLALLQFVPFAAGVVLLFAGLEAGVWLLAAGIALVVIASMIGAWVLLIEVQRD